MNRVLALRKEKGLTQRRLADLAGVSVPTIVNIETKGHVPSHASVRQGLARALGCSEKVLFAGRIPSAPKDPEPEPAGPSCRWCGRPCADPQRAKVVYQDECVLAYGHLDCLYEAIRTDDELLLRARRLTGRPSSWKGD